MTKLKYCYSHLKSFVVFMFWIVLFMFLNHLSIPHTPNPLFHPISFFSSQMHSLISFKSYTASYITNLDNSVHPNYPSSSSSSTFSSHTPFHSAFRMLFNAIHASFSTKKCTEPHIPSHHTISILSVLPQCDSAMNVLSIHPSLITLLLNQLSERNHTTVLKFHSYF